MHVCAHACTHTHTGKSIQDVATPQEFTPCDPTSTWAPLSLWTPLALRTVYTRTQPRVGTRCPRAAPPHQPAGLAVPRAAAGPPPRPPPARLPGPHQPASVLQTDFEKDVDLACRSGERLTGESDRWPSPGPTCFFLFLVHLSVHLSVLIPPLPPAAPSPQELLPEPWPEGDTGSGSGPSAALVCTSTHTPRQQAGSVGSGGPGSRGRVPSGPVLGTHSSAGLQPLPPPRRAVRPGKLCPRHTSPFLPPACPPSNSCSVCPSFPHCESSRGGGWGGSSDGGASVGAGGKQVGPTNEP